MASTLVKEYFREDKLPHIWCPGCGNGIVTRAIVKAIDSLGLDKDNVCIVSGIGCSSRAPGYLDFNTLHTTHGRALAFATGVKMAKPELEVIVITGDGDSSAIGGNHLIHACRRNIDITTIVFNNNIYGMTGGQYSPTTPTGDKGTTAPYGNLDANFDLCELTKGAGASYIARGTAYAAKQLEKFIAEGIKNKGFSFIEAITACPTYYGRKNKKGSAVDMLQTVKESAVMDKAWDRLSEEQRQGKFKIGSFHVEAKPEYTEEYKKLIASFNKGEE
ncbi:MAG: 2-oxoacid:ferredoxin oxidoreductase subunit beta [Tissierellia bacterium]|jgi:2-oxoglutarate ferredoxin oxidoreductase subunit beta|nr:2-oxoacid:ferredoxin oxidoreductase subunit beta [Tissierellia bacterium]